MHQRLVFTTYGEARLRSSHVLFTLPSGAASHPLCVPCSPVHSITGLTNAGNDRSDSLASLDAGHPSPRCLPSQGHAAEEPAAGARNYGHSHRRRSSTVVSYCSFDVRFGSLSAFAGTKPRAIGASIRAEPAGLIDCSRTGALMRRLGSNRRPQVHPHLAVSPT